MDADYFQYFGAENTDGWNRGCTQINADES